MSKMPLRHWLAVLLLLLFAGGSLTSAALSQESGTGDSTYVIIANDQSSSMFYAINERKSLSHNAQATEGLIRFFSSYRNNSCSVVNIELLPWGTLPGTPVRVALGIGADAGEFVTSILDVSEVSLSKTDTELGLRAAVDHLEDNQASHKILIVITDGIPDNHSIDDPLSTTIPSDVEVYIISLGSPDVQKYFQRHVLPAAYRANSYHVSAAKELEVAFALIFAEIAKQQTPCLG